MSELKLGNLNLGQGEPPKCGAAFIARLSNGRHVVASHPESPTGYFDYYDIDGSARVPLPETLDTQSIGEFLQITDWWGLADGIDY
ncbi:MAG: hypothetical protein HRU28_17325 [Rhizobiales bacterium]|nr:hypothetical protein [Hyphomicrobiales bacterium]